MAAELNYHIKLIGDNPLEATVAKRNTKAYIIAQFALADGAEATAELYEISLGAVYAAMSFYVDNQEAIEEALKEDEAALWEMGMIDGKEAIAEFKRRMENKK